MPKEMEPRRWFRYRIEYMLVRLAFWAFRLIGRKKASAIGGWIGRKVGPHLSANQTAIDNLKTAMPEFSDDERSAILDKMWDNLGRNAAELPFVHELDFMSPDFELVGREYLDEYIASDQPAFFITGHYGPWEATGVAGKYVERDMCIVYRPANNPWVEEYFQKERASSGYHFVPKGKSGAREILKALKIKKPIVLLNDQKQNNGIAIPFFGRDANTATAVADFACRMDLPVYPVRAERLENGRLRVTVSKAMYAPKGEDAQQNVVQFLTAINELYESWIRERPDHWFWVHKRW